MNKYKICVYAICKNEEKFVDRWVDSMAEADLIVVTDTGSEDTTVERLKSRGVTVYVDEIKPWRFDAARNVSLDHVPNDVDICVCTDLDEVFEEGWRECLESAWTPKTKLGKYIFNWSLKEDGSPNVQIYYTKIHARKDFKWSYPVHEWLTYLGKDPKLEVFLEGLVLNHYPDSSKSRGSYLPLLELAVEEDPTGDRVAYYLGREYMYKGQWHKCIDTLKRHLSLPSATWNEERCASMRWIAKSYYELGNIRECYAWYFRAIAEAPSMRDPYIECAKIAYTLADWPTVFFMVEEALKIKEKSRTYVNLGYAWDYTPDDLGAISCYRLQMYDRSLNHAEAALTFSPNDERLKNNLLLIKEKISAIKSDIHEVPEKKVLPMSNDPSEVTVLVLSCDNYSDTWQPFHTLFQKYWDCPYEVFIVTEAMDCKYFKTIKTTGSWTQRIKKALERIDTQYVIILLDDFFIRRKVDQQRIDYCISIFEPDIAVFNFETEYSPNIDVGLDGFKQRPNKSKYLCSCQPSIWNRKILIELLNIEMTAWEWELQMLDSAYRFFINSGGLIFDIGDKYCGRIIRGKWVRKDVFEFFKKENIHIDYSKRGFWGED